MTSSADGVVNAEPFAALGRIIKTHGLNGEVSVAPADGVSLSELIGTEVWFVPPATGVRSSRIGPVRSGPKGPLVTLEGITSVDAARLVCGAEILARHDGLPAGWDAPDDPADDLSGYTLVDERHGLIGEIIETIITGANDVWVVDGPFGEVLVPVIDDVVLDVDDSTHKISVALLDGLLPEEEGQR